MPPPLTPPVPQPQRKGLSALAWTGIGCGSFLLIFLIAGAFLFAAGKRKYDEYMRNPEKSAAEFVIKANPELEKVRESDANGTMTVRTKAGKEFTFKYRDIAQGKFAVEDENGNVTQLGSGDLSVVPAWVPRLPGLPAQVAVFHGMDQGKAAGTYTATLSGPKEAAEEFFRDEAARLGLTTSSNSHTTINGAGRSVQTFSDSSREISLMITSESASGPNRATVSYREK